MFMFFWDLECIIGIHINLYKEICFGFKSFGLQQNDRDLNSQIKIRLNTPAHHYHLLISLH